MSIRGRIWSLPAIAGIIFALGFAASFWFTKQTSDSLSRSAKTDYPLLERSQVVANALQQLRESFRSSVSEGDQEGMQKATALATAFRKAVDDLAAVPQGLESAEPIRRDFESYFRIASDVTRALLSENSAGANELIPKMQTAYQRLASTIAKVRAGAKAQFENGLLGGAHSAATALAINALSALIAIAALLAIAYLVIRSIWRALGCEPDYAAKIVRSIASGDLSQRPEETDDTDSVLASVNVLHEALSRLIADIGKLANEVSRESAAMSARHTDLWRRTQTQAASLEETAATMEELTSAVSQNQENARQAQTLSENNAARAQEGAGAMSDVALAMGEINQHSKQIEEIIAVIESIAFQTNILALNAAIEAARAGVHGRGFSAVAVEVRNLAQRSSQAAKEIRALIERSVAKVDKGSKQAQSAGTVVGLMVDSAQQVKAMITDIADASTQQAIGIARINDTVAQLESGMQRNSSLGRDSAAAAESLRQRAEELVNALLVFKLSTDLPLPEPVRHDVVQPLLTQMSG